jgi:hypothetical protein
MSRRNGTLEGYGSVWSAGNDALEDFLVKREAMKRQAMLDDIYVKHQASQDARADEQLGIQREQREALADERKATQRARRQAEALTVAGQLRPGAELDATGAAQFRDAGIGVLVQAPGARYTPADAAAAPAQFTDARLQPEAFTERETFRGTATQLDEAEKKRKLAEYMSKLPANSYVRQFLEAQDATGDSSLPAEMFKPKDEKHSPAYLEYQDATAAGYKGSFAQYQDEDANRKRPVVRVQTGEGGLTPSQQFNATEKLAATWQKSTAQEREMRMQHRKMTAALDGFDRDPNSASQAVITTFNRILDPTSVVRESEYARSAEGVSLLERMQGYQERLRAGGAGMPKAALAEMAKTAESFLSGMRASTAGQRRRIEATARQHRLDPALIFDDESPAAPAAGQSAPAAGAAVEQWVRDSKTGKLRRK